MQATQRRVAALMACSGSTRESLKLREMADADNKVVNPIGEIHPGENFREHLDSNCWNQMDFA